MIGYILNDNNNPGLQLKGVLIGRSPKAHWSNLMIGGPRNKT